MLFLNYCIFSGSAEALVRCGGKLQHLLIAYFLGNTYAKHYENPIMVSRLTAKHVGDVFLRHSVFTSCCITHSIILWTVYQPQSTMHFYSLLHDAGTACQYHLATSSLTTFRQVLNTDLMSSTRLSSHLSTDILHLLIIITINHSFHCPQNFKSSRKICCFAVEMSRAAEFRFFSAETVKFLKIHCKTNVLFNSLLPATHLKSNR